MESSFKDIKEGEENTLNLITLESLNELEHLKYSLNNDVRAKFFKQFSNSCSENASVVEELMKLRRDYATGLYSAQSFYHLQSKKNLIKAEGVLKDKIKAIRQVLRPYILRDLEIIQQITGEVQIRYYDMAHLKEKIRSLVISQDQNNIQMLTCFSVENVLNGLTILLIDHFKHKFKTRTIVLDEENA